LAQSGHFAAEFDPSQSSLFHRHVGEIARPFLPLKIVAELRSSMIA
jgi:hypothetical protein